MWQLGKKLISTGIQTENFEPLQDHIEVVGKTLQKHVLKCFGRTLAIRMVDAGSCNGCEQEINAINNPYYNIEQFGIHFVASPRHADMLLVTGPVTKNMKEPLLLTYEAIPDPKLVVAIGDCAACGGIFKNSYAVVGAVHDVIPVNMLVRGCPPSPVDIMSGILTVLTSYMPNKLSTK